MTFVNNLTYIYLESTEIIYIFFLKNLAYICVIRKLHHFVQQITLKQSL
jgi:hypothetical protein